MICVEVHSNNVITAYDTALKGAVANGVMHETVKFLFSDNWKPYQKTAVFSAEGVGSINIVLDSQNPLCIDENECYIPQEILTCEHFTLSVFGINGDSIATATKLEIDVLPSGYALGEAPKTPTPSEYGQIIDIMNKVKESMQSSANTGITVNYASNRFANAVWLQKSGNAVILDNISPIEHEVKIKLISDTVTDFSSATVEVYDTENNLLQTVFSLGDGTVAGIKTDKPVLLATNNSEHIIINAQYIADTKSYIENSAATDCTEQINTAVKQANTYTDAQIDILSQNAVLKENLKVLLLEAEHPIGSLYLTEDEDTDPSVLFGGNWERQTVNKAVANRTKIDNFEANTKHPTTVSGLAKHKLLFTDYSIVVTPYSGAPNVISASASNISTIDGYIDSFDIITYRSDATSFTVFWSISSTADFDQNGYYHWKRIA